MKKIVLIVCVIATSCKTIECDPFPNVPFFSYEKNQKCQFISDNDALTFTVTEFHGSEAWSFKSNCDCECDLHASVRLENQNIIISGESSSIDLNVDKNTFNFRYIIQQSYEVQNEFSFSMRNKSAIDTIIANKENPTYTWMKFSSDKGFYGFGNDKVEYILK